MPPRENVMLTMRFKNLALIILLAGSYLRCTASLPPAPASADGIVLKDMLGGLLAHGYRNFDNYKSLDGARSFIESYWTEVGYEVQLQTYKVKGKEVHNVVVQLGPAEGPQIFVGAHYDVAGNLPGADDNGSGTVGLMLFGQKLFPHANTLKTGVRLVAFTLEEPPFFQTSQMGSRVYANALKRAGTDVRLMISLEMIGYYSDEPRSQKFPKMFPQDGLPTVGNFICMVGRDQEEAEIQQLSSLMTLHSTVPIVPLLANTQVRGVTFSDHESFWRRGYPAVMLTDTAFFRNPHYHQRGDKIDTLHYDKMASLMQSLYLAILKLAE